MRQGLAATALTLAALAAAPAHAGPLSAAEWLQRMTDALATLNYDGLFTHTAGQQSETMRIVHRVDRGRSMERLVSLDGSGREIVRTAEEVHFYMPDRRVVLVERRTDEGTLLRGLPAPGPKLDALYTLDVRKGNKLLGRQVRVLDVLPRDVYRYGYRLWLDEETAMPLRSEVVNGEGRVVEAMHFTRLEVRDRISASELEPAVDAAGFQWVRAGKRGEPPAAHVGWRPRKVPPGFRLVATRMQVVPGVPMPVQHLIFSDGFASVSVFIEPGPAKGPSPPESTSVGSANAFSTQVWGHVITAIGEVPAATVRDLATSVAPVEDLAAPAKPAPERNDR
jgi:sigma-E factor negative regulatory protein RseB